MKNKLTLPMFFLAFFMVIACSLGAVSAANNIHDTKINDIFTYIQHDERAIQDSNIENAVINTDTSVIREGDSETDGGGPPVVSIIRSSINNLFSRSQNTNLEIGLYNGENGDEITDGVRDSDINNVVSQSDNTEISIAEGNRELGDTLVNYSRINNIVSQSHDTNISTADGSLVCDSDISNIVSNSKFTRISTFNQDFKNCEILNIVENSEGTYIHQFPIVTLGAVENSCLINTIYNTKNATSYLGISSNSTLTNTFISSEKVTVDQDFPFKPITNSNIQNIVLFSKNTGIQEYNLSGVNGLFIAIGCNGYLKNISDMTSTNFFNLTIGNLEIFNFHW